MVSCLLLSFLFATQVGTQHIIRKVHILKVKANSQKLSKTNVKNEFQKLEKKIGLSIHASKLDGDAVCFVGAVDAAAVFP